MRCFAPSVQMARWPGKAATCSHISGYLDLHTLVPVTMESCARDHRPLLPTGEGTSWAILVAGNMAWRGCLHHIPAGLFAGILGGLYHQRQLDCSEQEHRGTPSSLCTKGWRETGRVPKNKIIIGKPQGTLQMVPGTQWGLDSCLQRINESSRCGCTRALSTPQGPGHMLLWLFVGKWSCRGHVLLVLGSGRVGWCAVGQHVDSPGGRNEAMGWAFHLLGKTAALSILGNKLRGFVAFLPSLRTFSVPT